MDVEIKFSKGRIILRAKDETYLSAKSILSDKERTDEQRYNMQAGDNKVHERKLMSSLGTALSELKSAFEGYRIKDDMTDRKDGFTLCFSLSDRFMLERENDLQRMVEEYLYRRIVADWWQTNYPDMSSPYIANASVSLESIRKIISLSNPYDSLKGNKFKCFCMRNYRVVHLFKEEMVNEIHMEMLKLSRTRKNERGVPDLDLQTDEIRSEHLITRYINRHVGRVCSRINAYLYDLTNTVDNDSLDRTPVYEFKLVMPEGWDGRLFEQLAEEMHSYIVNASLFELLKTHLTDMASIYGTQADVAYGNIKHVITVRKPGFVFKPLQPF